MTRDSYIDFIEKFEELSPFELDHLSKILLQHYNVWLTAQTDGNKRSLNHRDVKEMLIQAIKETHLGLAERQVENAQMKLTSLKAKYYEQS